MTENEAINVLKMVEAHGCLVIEAKIMAIKALEEIQQYRAIGTLEELQEAKMQYDNIHSVAEKTALIGLSDYGTAKESLITEMKRSLDYSLKEYQSIGTVEEFKDLKEKSVAKKARFYAHNYYCTECGNLVGNNEFEWQRFLYCDECGQKLDWQ